MPDYPEPPFPDQPQSIPGITDQMDPKPDHGEESYRGSGKLAGKRAIITGGDSGIGRAVAIAFAREGADVLISHLPEEEEDAAETARWIEQAERNCVRIAGDLSDPDHCRAIIARALGELGGIDILVNNAAHQQTYSDLSEIPEDDWELTFKVNIHAMFHLSKAAVAHMAPGSAIINTTSVQADNPSPDLLAYAATKAAIQNFTGGLSQMLADRGIRVNCVAPGPIWTPLIPATMPSEKVTQFGSQVPFRRPGQPAELAPVYVMLASAEATYVSGATIAVTGGKPII